MAYAVEIETTTTMTMSLDVEMAAKWFCALDDEKQADFFIACAREAKSWQGRAGYQWYLVGAHLRNCECSTDDAREMVRDLHGGMVSA
jgi:hypothetical protein